MGEIVHLFESVRRGKAVRESPQVTAIEDKGFKDCLHGRPGSSRQVLLIDIETLQAFEIFPGQVKENITTRGLSLGDLSAGQQLRAGKARLEVTKTCEPCGYLDRIRPGLRKAMRGRRGILCRVITPGKIHRGDRIDIEMYDSMRGISRRGETSPVPYKGANA